MLNKLLYVFSTLLIISTTVSCLVTEDDIVPYEPVKEIQTDEHIAPISDDFIIAPDFDFDGTIARWFNFSQAASSVTFDDGTYDQYAVAFPIMEELGIRGTFYLAAEPVTTGEWNDNGTIRKMMTWLHASRIASSGHEIGSHSISHPDLSLPGADLETELAGSREYIRKYLPDVTVETFCWPHWRETAGSIKKATEFYISARSGNAVIDYYLDRKGGIPSNPPRTMHAVNAFGLMSSHKKNEWTGLIDRIYDEGSWFVSSYHGVDNGSLPENNMGWDPLPEEMFRETLTYTIAKGFWIDTFVNVSKYINERDAALLHIKNRKKSIEIILEDQLDDRIYNQPLSISLKLPESWTSAAVRNNNGVEIPAVIRMNTIFLDIFPDGKKIEIKPY